MSQNKGGRPVGTGKAQINANKALKNVEEIMKRVNDDSLRAYEILIEMMNNPDTKDTVKRGIAKEIIDMQLKFAAEAPEALGAPTNRHEEKKQQIADTAKKVVTFSTKA